MFEKLKKIFAKKEPERVQKPVPEPDADLNRIYMLINCAETAYITRKISYEEYIDQLAFVEIMGLKMAERRIEALEANVWAS